MKKLKDILPLAGFIPAIIVAVFVYVSLDQYVPKTYEINASQDGMTSEDETEKSEKQSRDHKEQETETETDTTKAAAAVLTKIDENAKYRDGIYYGTGTGFAGDLTVKVVISDGKITSISITETKDGDEFIKKASSILTNIVNSQSTNVDTVSGATYSSVGIIEAVRNALKQAVVSGSEEELENAVTVAALKESSTAKSSPERLSSIKEEYKYKDGIYYGTGTGFAGELKVKVVVKNGEIYNINIVETKDGDEFIESASSILKTIVKKQTTNVDVVSGATYSSNGIIEAVRDALSGAVISTDNTNDTTVPVTTTREKETKTTKQEQTTSGRKIKYKDGVYYGTGEGFRGDITVAVVIENDKIQYILVTDSDDDDAFISKAKGLIPSIVKKQSTNVDVVSGATFSSNGIIDAVNSALEDAAKKSGSDDTTTADETTEKKTTEKITTEKPTATDTANTDETTDDSEPATETTSNNKYKSGTYTVVVDCTPDDSWDFDEYRLSATIVINNDIVTEIKDVKGTGAGYDSSNDWYISRAQNGTARCPGIVSQIVGTKKTDADVVSGATCSSKAIIEAVKKAFSEAERLK